MVHRSISSVLLACVLALGLGSSHAVAAPELVAFEADAAPGTIFVMTDERRLYLVVDRGEALKYVVGVGRAGWQWQGSSTINGKFLRPNWAPPDAIRREEPGLPAVIPSGSPANPMGDAAMTLAGTDYAIHGTNSPKLIGGFVSHGCIRMQNADITDLYGRVGIGTPVVVRP